MKAAAALQIALALVTACGATGEGQDEGAPQGDQVGTARQPWMSGAGPTRGHEDLTRFGVEMANAAIAGDAGPKKFYPEVIQGEACAATANELLAGNCATDWPTDEMTAYYGVASSDFGDAPGLQDLHSLRNFDDSNDAVSGRYACHLIRERIVNATQRGLSFWQQADEAAGLRWIGHATHTVQDSFTPCHTTRTGTRFETMTDICTYGLVFTGVCTHHKPDFADTVWRATPLECTFSTTRSWDCLVDTAQQASKATAGYLTTVQRLIGAKNFGGAPAALETWFEGDPSIAESGYFRCDGLKADGVEPDGWAPPLVEAGVADAKLDAPEASADAAEEHPLDAAQEPAAEASAVDAGRPETGQDAAVDATAESQGSVDAEPVAAQSAAVDDGGCSCGAAGQRGAGSSGLAAAVVLMGFRRRRRGLLEP